jgi:UDP-N-acetylmuramate--alanine ligase
MKVGIFFGGQSKEREISFAGGRTVYDNLDKSLFEPVPIFVDSLGNFILLNWQFIYKGTIRDFYPANKFYPESEKGFQLYIESLQNITEQEITQIIQSVGQQVFPQNFCKLFDVAFLALHGTYGEDGAIQGLLEWFNIPYSGCGILPSAIGINKIVQKNLMRNAGFSVQKFEVFSRDFWQKSTQEVKQSFFEDLILKISLPFVIKSPNQGSSIGISVINSNNFSDFKKAIDRSLFVEELVKEDWDALDKTQKHRFITDLADIRVGIGLPVLAKAPFSKGLGGTVLYSPNSLLAFIENHFHWRYEAILLENLHGENQILVEKFVEGREFSCIVIQDEDGKPLALPPTEIVKSKNVFDYRAKYLPGIARKVTPINLPISEIQKIASNCEKLFTELNCNVYARIDGFYTSNGEVVLNDPNTTSGMLPSSFFFHQAAEIGLTPSQFLTYILKTSLHERLKQGKNIHKIKLLIKNLDDTIHLQKTELTQKIKVGVILGGFSAERHISVESGRNIFEKLASSIKYQPIPIFLTLPKDDQVSEQFELYQLPINVLLKDNADDIREKVIKIEEKHPFIQNLELKSEAIRQKFTINATLQVKKISIEQLSKEVQAVFIALHGRPGEDGQIQLLLEKYNIPYNGSGPKSSSVTINKYETNEQLANAGFLVARHVLVEFSKDFMDNETNWAENIEKQFSYPIIAKPHDDGCSAAVKKLKNRADLTAYARQIFRNHPEFLLKEAQILNLKLDEEFPRKTCFLIEELIEKQNAVHFLEITGGMLTSINANGEIQYEVFEPSETLASGDILTLEEKFLAGEGQNITPARFSKYPQIQKLITNQVKETLKNVAKTLHVEGYGRIDAFVRIFDDNSCETIIIEINSLPGMTPATCIFHQCAISGYKPYEFMDKILEYGMLKNNLLK